jgi:hypothetical protein
VKRLEIDTRRGAGRPIVLIALIVAALVVTTVWYREGDNGPLHAARTGLTAASQPFSVVATWISTPFRAVSNWFSGTSCVMIELGNDFHKTQ